MGPLLHMAIELAERAAARILEIYHSDDFETRIKADGSPLTAADLASHAVITDGLRNNSPYPVVSEEDTVPVEARCKESDVWFVDPLDGTKDFVARNGEFTVNIGLSRAGQPVLGVIAIPETGELYFAERGQGAFRKAGGAILRISNKRNGGAPLVAGVSRLHAGAATEAFLRKNGIEQTVKAGSSIKLCRLAEGIIDIYPRLGPTMEWDICAGQCIAEEAGCAVLSIPGAAPLVYNKPDLRNPHFLALRRGLEVGQFSFE